MTGGVRPPGRTPLPIPTQLKGRNMLRESMRSRLLSSRLLRGATAATALVLLTSTATTVLAARADVPSTAAVASSAGQVAWSMTPVITDIGEERSNFSYALEPGASVEDAVLVRNAGSVPLDLVVQGSDAFTDDSGALDIATESAADGVSAWVPPSADSVHIEPGGVVRVPFQVRVPADAPPGEHAGALLTVLASDGDTVSVDMRYATRVTVTVAGELTAGLALDDAALDVTSGFWPWDPATAEVSYTVRNTGNTRLGALQLISAPGVELYSAPDPASGFASLAELLPDAEVTVHAAVPGVSLWSPFTVVDVSVSPSVLVSEASAELEQPEIAQQQVRLSAVAMAPGWWVLFGAAVMLAAIAVRMLRARRRASDKGNEKVSTP